MTYPGNPSLAAAVRDRVASTFQQTLALYKQGRSEDVLAGCNLILQMDPMFDPAKKLLEKTRNPAAPIDVDSLGTAAAPGLPQLEAARQAMASRDFNRVIHITGEILTNDLMNEEARLLGDEAREKLEAAPFVEQFARKCDQQLAAGNVAGARMELDKARALDATHPEVVRVGKAIAARANAPAPPPPPSSSFVVDDRTQQATGRASTPAADFGFTFEEDAKPAADAPSFANFSFDSGAATPVDDSNFSNFSFDAPATPASDSPFSGFSFDGGAAPVEGTPHEFDFTTASIATSDDDQQKIAQFLTDGDRAYNAGDYQQAIDLWSRIFLIDVTNEQASERIERAKSKRRDIEDELDTRLASATAAFDRRDFNAARNELGEVLRLDPHNAQAHDYLDRIETATLQRPAAGRPATAAGNLAIPPPSVASDDLDFGMFDDELPATGDAPLIPPDPGAMAAAPAAAKAKKSEPSKARPAAARKLPMGALAAIVGVLVLGAAGWFAWSRFHGEAEPQPVATQAVFARATNLANHGKYDQAIALLQDVPATDPQHDRALVMIADLQQKKSKTASLIDGVPASQYYDQKVTSAQAAFNAHDYAAAKADLDDAQKVHPLPPEVKALYDNAAQQVAKLDAAKTLFDERKYGDAIAALQPLLAADPQNQNIARMIVNAHFNLGAAALQEEKTEEAIREFDEVLKSEPNDELARRSRDLAVHYKDETKDLLYQIYVKYLPLRQPT
ncbi:MAG: tetratricopeptide repeat protein [Acidobacteria bacterium]|nr:tetratricopeptide repeat protein [Acidobacteriota bacterium]MBV9476721.1 tetratricopeptide repeat protein [Acidobacteriota bacterium]